MDRNEIEEALIQLATLWHTSRLAAEPRTHFRLQRDNFPEVARRLKIRYDAVKNHLFESDGLDQHKLAAVFCHALADPDTFDELFRADRGSVYDRDNWRDGCRIDLALETFLALLKCDPAALDVKVRRGLEYLLIAEAPQPLTLAMIGFLLEQSYPGR